MARPAFAGSGVSILPVDKCFTAIAVSLKPKPDRIEVDEEIRGLISRRKILSPSSRNWKLVGPNGRRWDAIRRIGPMNGDESTTSATLVNPALSRVRLIAKI